MNRLHLTAILVIKAVFVGAEDAKETDLTTVCHAAIYLAALEEQLSTEVEAAKTDVTELDKHRRRLTLVAEIGSGTDAGCLLAAAAAAAAQHTKEASEAINTAIKNKAEGLKHLAHFTKTAEAAVKMSNTEFEIKTGAHKQVSASSTAHKLTPKLKTPDACQVTKTQKKWQAGAKDIKPKLIEKFITADSNDILKNINPSIIAITYNSRCGGSDTWTSWSAAQKSCTIDNIATIGAGQTATPATAGDATQGKTKKIKIYKDDKPDQGCEPLATNGGKDDDQKTSLYKICKALTTEIKMPKPLDLTGAALSQIPIVKQVAKGCLRQYKDKTEMKPEDEENLTTFFKDAYTDSTTKFEAKFKKLLADTKMLVYRGGKVQPVTIDTIIDDSEENDALSRLRASRAGSALTSDKSVDTTSQKELGKDAGDKKDGDNKTTAADCTRTQQDKCDKNKCTWDKEKNQCQVKGGAVVISGVIKAPLLLEFSISN
ncbi:variant surface glycoprotein [Trypanosoma brucei equiperdum]|uniref:Variant surface glycoprotein n=1 Tax=Trypanosoma brucei equiperdum TaxID=630700 RepID=A0A3L6L3F9_9TRYP|nr:variant surface glycoprotein [Trypanosoma brucei equiperdum]